MALSLPRRFQSLIWLFLLVIVAFIFLSSREDGGQWLSPKSWRMPYTAGEDDIPSWNGQAEKIDGPVKISIMETDGVHDEVAAALVTAFGGHDNAELSLFFKRQRFGMEDIIATLSLAAPIVANKPSSALFDAETSNNIPHVLVSTTCEVDLSRNEAPIRNMLVNGTTHLFCTVHHADRWVDGKHVDVAREWGRHNRLTFITLSHHTAEFLEKNSSLFGWASRVEASVHVLPPVFEANVPEYDPSKGLSLAMQGDYSSGRRNYQGIFENLEGVIGKLNESKTAYENDTIAMHVIGHGRPPQVPKSVEDYVSFDSNLSYPDFYSLLSRSFSIVPGFASDEYLDRKASSTVPASLIAGAPLVVDEDILKAYSYLPREIAWVAEEGEGEMDVIKRVITDKDEFMNKRKLVKEARERLIKENQQNIQEWISKAFVAS